MIDIAMKESPVKKWDPSILKGLEMVGLDPGTICYPWDITPVEYLGFAREELKASNNRSRINAIGHAKRAIHAHVDFLLHNCGRCLREADFPEKLELLHRLGIVAPSILTRYNRLRNLMEHEYIAPSQEEVEEVTDVAELFLNATLRYIRPLPDTLTFLPTTGKGALTMGCSPHIGLGCAVGSNSAASSPLAFSPISLTLQRRVEQSSQ